MIRQLLIRLCFIGAALCGAALWSCNSDADIYPETEASKPQIWFEAGSIYKVKIGQEVEITPLVKHGMNGIIDDPSYTYNYEWWIDDRIVSTDRVFLKTFDEKQEVFVTLRVITQKDGGKAEAAEKEARIDVGDTQPPQVSLSESVDGVLLEVGARHTFVPYVKYGEDAEYEWTLDGKAVGEEAEYTFEAKAVGNHTLALRARNADGESNVAEVAIEVVELAPIGIIVPKQSMFDDPALKHASSGRPLHLRIMEVVNAKSPTYSWRVDGQPQEGKNGLAFVFTPTEKGKDYKVVFTVTDTYQKNGSTLERSEEYEFTVKCHGEESTLRRPATGNRLWNKVHEYTAAPGQFINEPKSGYDNVTSPQAACAYAEKRLKEKLYVSLGGFGGYIIVGFDHSIENNGAGKSYNFSITGNQGGHGQQADGYDFSITGNQFKGSSEPGIVWVSQDINKDGVPNDPWYELRGSETGKDGETIQDYAVTYFRPSGPKMAVQWKDNQGNTGMIDYDIVEEYHWQDYYYPLWINEGSYTLYGTRLQHRTTQDPQTGFWYNAEFEWGYADNLGTDRLTGGENPNADPMKTYFKISNAMNPDLSPANLLFIDFVKVQTGVNVKAGWLGEISTEVFGFEDENP